VVPATVRREPAFDLRQQRCGVAAVCHDKIDTLVIDERQADSEGAIRLQDEGGAD
jgi:hypothetical protein